MSDEPKLTIAGVISIILSLALGWYALVAVSAISFIIAIWLFVSDANNTNKSQKKMGIGMMLFSWIVMSVIGCVFVIVGMLFRGCVNDDGPGFDKIERRTKIHTPDGDKMPTMSEHGEYRNAGTGERQIEYGGSIEQEQDLKAADRLIENGY